MSIWNVINLDDGDPEPGEQPDGDRKTDWRGCASG